MKNCSNQYPEKRLETRFQDANPLYTESEAMIEANRCLYCFDAPCISACPAGINIPEFIRKIASGNQRGAALTIFRSNLLGVSTARVCPVEELCVGACVYNRYNKQPINIGRLQRYATENGLQIEKESRKLFTAKPPVNRKVALIGAGPASLSCAAYLSLAGVQTTIFEKHGFPGGLNTSGIAPYKLFANDAKIEIDWLCESNIEIKTNQEIGSNISIEQLQSEFDTVFLGVGLGKDKFSGIPGENENGVWGATELIRKIKLERNFELPANLKNVIVIGGGNTAIDIAGELAMLGVPFVNIVYRRTTAEMPGYRHELEKAKQFGVRLIEQMLPQKITRNMNSSLTLETKHKITGQISQFSSDWIVIAIGQEKLVGGLFPEIETDGSGCVLVDPVTRRTSNPKVYAGGDCVNGGKEVINAVTDGREAAFAMLRDFGF